KRQFYDLNKKREQLHVHKYVYDYPTPNCPLLGCPGLFGQPPAGQNWDGAQTTVQLWDTDPLVNNTGSDRTLRTVFTHDHFGPSTHQQAGLYAGLVVEPPGSKWLNAETGAPLQNPARDDGGPTSWQAIIVTSHKGPGVGPNYREFLLEFQDRQLAYVFNSRSQ